MSYGQPLRLSGRTEDTGESVHAYMDANVSPPTCHNNAEPSFEQQRTTSWIPTTEYLYQYNDDRHTGAYLDLNSEGLRVSCFTGCLTSTIATSNAADPDAILLRNNFHDTSRPSPLIQLPMPHGAGFDRHTANETPLDGAGGCIYPPRLDNSQVHGPMPRSLPYGSTGWSCPEGTQLSKDATYPMNGPNHSMPRTTLGQVNVFPSGDLVPIQTIRYPEPVTTASLSRGYEHESYAPSNGAIYDTVGKDWTSKTNFAMGQPSDSLQALDSGRSSGRWCTDLCRAYYGTDNDALAPGASNSGSETPHQSIPYEFQTSMNQVPVFTQTTHASSNSPTTHPSSPESYSPFVKENLLAPRQRVRNRRNGQRSGKRSPNLQKTNLQPSHDVSANRGSYRFEPYARPENLCFSDGGNDPFTTRPGQSTHSVSGDQAAVSIQTTDPPLVDSHPRNDLLYDPGQQDPGSSQLADRPNGIASFVNPMARSTLYPTLDSPLMSSLKEYLPYPLDGYFSQSRPEDSWQPAFEMLLNELSITAATLAECNTTQLPEILNSLCERNLYSVERKGAKKGVTSIKCAIGDCPKKFGKHNVARNLTHHLIKEHWELSPFMCHDTSCGMTFAWPDDRARHEKDQHNFTYEPHS